MKDEIQSLSWQESSDVLWMQQDETLQEWVSMKCHLTLFSAYYPVSLVMIWLNKEEFL
jgi:hypothetical protein